VWEKNVVSGLEMFKRTRTTLADNFAPDYIVQRSFIPFSYLSLVLPEYGPRVGTDGPVAGSLITVNGAGHLVPARVRRVVASFDPRKRCGMAAASEFAVPRRIVMTLSPIELYYAQLTYTTAATAHLPLYVDDGGGYSGGPKRLVGVTAGTRQSIAWLGPGIPHALRVVSPPYVCLRRISVDILSGS
jgi:hypothetical protein